MESYEKQEIPRAFRGRATGKEENQPRTPGNLQHEARERGKAVSCLRSEESHSTRTTFRAPSLKRKASQRAVVDPTEDHSPLLPRGGQRGTGGREANHASFPREPSSLCAPPEAEPGPALQPARIASASSVFCKAAV